MLRSTYPFMAGHVPGWVKNHRKIDLKDHNNVNNKSCNLIRNKMYHKISSKYKIKSYESIYFDSKKNINFLGEAILIFEDKKIYLEKGDSHQLLSNVKYQLNNPKDIVLELIVFTF